MFKVIKWILVSRSKLLSDLLQQYWPQEFLVKLNATIPEDITTVELSQHSLMLIDLSTVDLQTAYQLTRLAEKSIAPIKIAYLHYPRKVDAKFLLNPLYTAGVFYCNQSLLEISDGLSNILRGERAIPHALAEETFNLEAIETDALTLREREVLQALLSGSTNQDIAKKLYVSESTIKTHLYRAFRKIGVSSRGQAIAWAQQHMHEVRV
ncbi:LuxR C-terminal-related transcriptional regulator [Shewanella sp. NIFS-20-20]|uniref:LuxR C-terminal-related transcriptional regulator n=1 Tax=Shewanella sp. NIFS-20-20 TaxID=2853806 RepID=UPI001C471E7A|nr:LuxR C-terminal-related transcriptional regulator [Shewanella sp. NIFS-20-20]MBV7317090.1 LuxR C-terminal-related transcriptional regulator [Shewanella sp. NIFS-20-20]